LPTHQRSTGARSAHRDTFAPALDLEPPCSGILAAMRRTPLLPLLALLAACGADPDTNDTTAGTTTTGTTTATPSTSTSDPPPDPTTEDPTTGAPSTTTSGTSTTTQGPSTTTTTTTTTGTTTDDPGTTTEAQPTGPMVDLSDPQLYTFSFTPDEADPAAALALGDELAQLDTTVPLQGRLVVYLHGAGAPEACGSYTHGVVLASMGFHVIHPCYVSDYGVNNCGDDIGGCRLEAFEGVDHHPYISIPPPDSIETRIIKMLEHLQAMHPGGDWAYFIDGGAPRWSQIVISGISHGASSSGVIGMNRAVDRVVMLSGPLDSGQAWLTGVPLTPIENFYALTHTADDQHPGHLESFLAMNLPGEPVDVDTTAPPYADSHRLVSSTPTDNGHVSTQAGGSSPKDGDLYVFEPVWRTMYGAD
jgi:hypothetical protein